jgi:UDP-N-acetylglucosamine diphosphorylase/glucosamine-1-phosphate N-acetyltransferase
MKTAIVLFEDATYPDFYPLTRLRPAFDLRCGAFSLRERLSAVGCWLLAERRLVAEAAGIKPFAISKLKPPVILINGRGCFSDKDLALLTGVRGNTVWAEGQEIVAIKLVSDDVVARLKKCDQPTADNLQLIASSCKREEVNGKLYHYLWDLVNDNGDVIARDFARFKDCGYKLPAGTHAIGKRSRLKICAGVTIDPGVVIDTTKGPVIIDRGARVRPLTLIEGPCYVGQHTLVDGAKLRPGCSIGAHCKVAGEVEESIVLDFSNKHHDGFLGHAYLGSWVNLGAQTCNSDLKNNYGPVSVWLNERVVNTGSIKAGCYIGDHTKTAIGTMINTGTMIGIGCNVHGGTVRKCLPDFSWGHSDKHIEHSLIKMLETANAVMSRRKQALGGPMQRQLRDLHARAHTARIHTDKEGGS